MCKCTPTDRSTRYCGRVGCDSKTHLRDAMDRFPEREKDNDIRKEAALCIEMLGQRLKASQLAVDAVDNASRRQERTLIELQSWHVLSRLNAQRKLHRRAQRAEGLYARLRELLIDTQACLRLGIASRENAIRRLLGYDFAHLPKSLIDADDALKKSEP